MVLLSLSFDSLHGILRRLYDEMTELCQPMMTLATAIAALGALFYIAYRVWQSLSRAEPVDVFGMLRPFCLGICILFFDVIVLGSLNGILSPVVQGTGAMLHDQTFDVRKFQEEKDRLLSEMPLKVAVTGEFNPTDEELEKEIADMGWNGEDYAVMQRMSHTCYSFSLQSIVQTIMRKVMEFLFRAASLVVDTIRTFFLIVLSVLGPIAFAISVFDGFPGHARAVAGPLYQRIPLAAHLRPARGDARQDTDAGAAKRDGNDTGSPERLLPGRIDGHLSGVHAHRAGGILLCPYRGELGGTGRRHGGVQPEHEQHGKQGRQRGRGRSRGIHGQRGRSAAEEVRTNRVITFIHFKTWNSRA